MTSLYQFTAGQCTILANQPTNNLEGETYGTGSRCFAHGRIWNVTTGAVTQSPNNEFGSGCYQVSTVPVSLLYAHNIQT